MRTYTTFLRALEHVINNAGRLSSEPEGPYYCRLPQLYRLALRELGLLLGDGMSVPRPEFNHGDMSNRNTHFDVYVHPVDYKGAERTLQRLEEFVAQRTSRGTFFLGIKIDPAELLDERTRRIQEIGEP